MKTLICSHDLPCYLARYSRYLSRCVPQWVLRCVLFGMMLLGAMLAPAMALTEMGALHAKSAVLYAANGQELYSYNADQPLQPASVTKIMTMLLAMEALERGEVTLDTMITGSDYACSMGGTQIWLEPGEQLSLNDMLKAIAVGSANDCAVAVAEHIAGTESAFVGRMNARALELGCTNTQFINANGLDGIGQKTLTTAHDLALISCELLKHPKILEYTGIWMDSIRGGRFSLANTNKMLKSYPGMTGLKTGYIAEAGFCISATAEREGLSLVAVVMAAPTKEARMADATALLNYGFANFTCYTPSGDALPPIPVLLGKAESVQPLMQSGSLILEKTQLAQLETVVDVPESIPAPVTAGQQLGTLTIRSGGRTLLEVPLTAAVDVEAKGLLDFFAAFFGGLLQGEHSSETPPESLDSPDSPDAPASPDSSDTPGTSGTPEESQESPTPEVSDAPGTSEKPNTPEAPDSSNPPSSPETTTPSTPSTSGTPDTSGTSAVPAPDMSAPAPVSGLTGIGDLLSP